MQTTSNRSCCAHMIAPIKMLYRIGLATLVLFTAAGCAIVPGDQTYGMREQSSVKLPVTQAGEVVPANVKVVPITADLIIQEEKAAKAARAELQEQQSKYTTNMFPSPSEYKIGPGDILSITVWDHPELTIPAGSYRSADQAGNLVGDDGTFYYPYAGKIPAAGKTVSEVRDILAKRLSRVIEKAQVDVRVITFRSKKVYVVGEVKTPGVLQITDIPLTVVDAVNQLGGFTTEADHSQVLLTRDGKTWRVDLQSLYEEGDVEQNALLQPGDIVNVSDRSQNKVFVLGDIQKPGSLFMNKRHMSLAEALSDAGYIKQDTANPHWIFVMRGLAAKPELFHLDSKSPDALLLADRFPLRPRDIVYVDTSELARWNRVISQVLPTATLLDTISATPYPLINGRPH